MIRRTLIALAAASIPVESALAQSVAPTLPLTASGDLTGYYPNPVVAAGAISNAKLVNGPPLTLKGNPSGPYPVEQDIFLGANLSISTVGPVSTLNANDPFATAILPAGSLSAASWGNNGLQLGGPGVTCTDTSATGSVGSEGCFSFPPATLAATNTRTVTNLYELYLPAPIPGSGVGTSPPPTLYSLMTAGAAKIGGGLNVTGGAINLDVADNDAVNICTAVGCTQTVSIGNSANSTAIGGPVTLASTVNGLTLTALSTGFQIGGGTTPKTAAFLNSLTFAGTDGKTMTFPGTSASIARTDAGQTFTGAQVFSNGVTFSSGVTFSGNIGFGPDAAGPGVAMNLQGNNAAMGNTDKAGGALRLTGGVGTGKGLGGAVVIRTAPASSSSSSSQNSPTAAHTFDANAHEFSGGNLPVVSTCGTGATIDGSATDSAGQVTAGTGTVTSCTISFNIAYRSYAHCIVAAETAIAGFGYHYSLTAITVTASSTPSLASTNIDYRCEGS